MCVGWGLKLRPFELDDEGRIVGRFHGPAVGSDNPLEKRISQRFCWTIGPRVIGLARLGVGPGMPVPGAAFFPANLKELVDRGPAQDAFPGGGARLSSPSDDAR